MASSSLAQAETLTLPDNHKRKASSHAAEEEEEEEEEREIQELEREVADLGRRILDHRRSAAGRLLDVAVSRLAALRPPTRLEVPAQSGSINGTNLAEADQEKLEKLQVFRSKTEANIAAMPNLLKRMNECVTRIEKLEQCNVNIHPVFRRKR